MTDPMTVAIATAMAGKAVEVAGEPVREAVAELSRRVRERLRRRPADEEALAGAGNETERISLLENAIRVLMNEDPAFGAELTAVWSQAHTSAAATGGGVVNIFGGSAEKVVQLRDVHGDLNIG